ncbi:MAG: hypothetical protein IT285_12835 [Bdellovibrionales bacterium]|nr:hypothetical protein [Bdellovibrionales bacterium]
MTNAQSSTGAVWKRCSSCKAPIAHGAAYYVCNVSTCNRKRTGLVFCKVSCWDAHLAVVSHRESWAEDRQAPSEAEWKTQLEEEAKPRTRGPRRSAEPEPSPAPALKASPAPKVIVRRPGGSSS